MLNIEKLLLDEADWVIVCLASMKVCEHCVHQESEMGDCPLDEGSTMVADTYCFEGNVNWLISEKKEERKERHEGTCVCNEGRCEGFCNCETDSISN